MRTVQLMGDGVEELWVFSDFVEDEQIQDWYKDYVNSNYESFEEYMEEVNPLQVCERLFVDEIYV